jgi:hypothetical protein
MKTSISQLKKSLYLSLLRKGAGLLTDTEVNIMYSLSLDYDVQEVLEKAKEENNVPETKKKI